MKKAENHIRLAILLALLTSVAPMGIDTYIPSIPNIAETFNVGIDKVEFSLSIFLIGLSIGQVFGGPISDKFGRKISSIYGLIGFSLFSLMIIFSSTIYEVWIYRFFEAFCGGIVLVNTSAVVRDKFKGKESAKVFSIIGTVRSVAPLIAPAIGAFIIHFFPWEMVFVFLAVYPLIIALVVYISFEESYTYVQQNVFSSFYQVFSHKTALKAMIVLGFGFSGLFIFIIKSSFIFMEYYKISTDYFPLFFSVNFIVLLLLTRVNIFFLGKFTPKELIKIAVLLQTIVSILILIDYKDLSLVQCVIYLAIYIGLMAFVFGNCLALALEHFPTNAGVASSVSGVLQFGMAAIITSIVLSFHSHDFLAIAVSFTLLSSISYLVIRTYKE